jgi:hypothetical protein
VAASSFTVNSANQITATAPPESAGTVDIAVTSSGGTSSTASADQFSFVPAPTINGLTPTGGAASGGTVVTITGSNFSGANSVKFGNVPASFTVNSATQITATAPQESAGTVDVTVSTPGGTSGTCSWDHYTFVNPPVAQNDTLSVVHDQMGSVNLSSDVSDPNGYPLTLNIVQGPSHGALAFDSDTGLYDYIPGVHFVGNDSFTFSANNGVVNSNIATVALSVINTAPTATGGSLTVEEGQVLPDIDLNQYVTDAEGDPLTISIMVPPSHGTLTQNNDGTYILASNSGFVGTDSFQIKANDGVADSNIATISINVAPYAPTSNNAYSLLHDQTLPEINFALNDSDAGGNPAYIDIVSGPANGTLSRNLDGTFNLAPDAHSYGNDSITIVADIPNVNGPWQPMTIGINVTDNAPVAVDTYIPIEAYQGVYSDIAFLADVTDADGDPLSFDIVSGPEHGSLVLNSSTALYDYTATAGYLGRDSIAVRYYDGAEYSQIVDIDILVYDDSTNFANASYLQGFGDLTGAAFNGLPSPTGIHQGNLDDCWFVAAEAGLANGVPASFQAGLGAYGTPIIADRGPVAGGAENYLVTFPGQTPVSINYTPGQTYTDPTDATNQMSFSTNVGNGDWSAILEQAYAGLMAPSSATWPEAIKQFLDRPSVGAVAIRALTGNEAHERSFRLSWNSTTASLLSRLDNGFIITASAQYPKGSNNNHGLVEGGHCYTVLNYNSTTQMVHLRNPWGYNKPWSEWERTPYALKGWAAIRHPALGTPIPGTNLGSADFWLPLADFCSWFSGMDYEYEA